VRLPGPDHPAPAKLNLFLHVVGRRDDGYHLLQSVFALIDRQDLLRFRVREDGAVRRVNDVAGIAEDEDLVVRAARLLKAETKTPLGADIELEKHIPVGGGLGGGSSDAATTLVALDRLWKTGLGEERLRLLGQRLGADVPFFVHGRNAWVEGIGERLTDIELPRRWYVVLVPPVHISTPLVFAAPELTRNTEALKMEDFSAQTGGAGQVQSVPGFRNDLEAVVTNRFPVVGEYLEWLSKRAPARLTGSGGCVFAAFDRREEADRVFADRSASMEGFVAQGLEKHPLR
jgi:4-diphosphocytidyl-2-C-methyl-D-erythritol kinase